MGRVEVNVDIAIKLVVENRFGLLFTCNSLLRVLYQGMTLIKHCLDNNNLILSRLLRIMHQR